MLSYSRISILPYRYCSMLSYYSHYHHIIWSCYCMINLSYCDVRLINRHTPYKSIQSARWPPQAICKSRFPPPAIAKEQVATKLSYKTAPPPPFTVAGGGNLLLLIAGSDPHALYDCWLWPPLPSTIWCGMTWSSKLSPPTLNNKHTHTIKHIHNQLNKQIILRIWLCYIIVLSSLDAHPIKSIQCHMNKHIWSHDYVEQVFPA